MSEELLNIKIDGKSYSLPQGLSILEAAAQVGIEIPHFCYHPCLKSVGHCRMCQVEVVNMPKLTVACHTKITDGMEIKTHHSSEAVRQAQKAVLEFLLLNHPVDCTICDQAGRCELQNIYAKYSLAPSRFKEEKEHKKKFVSFGKNIIYDAERCIKCQRCIRFCNEITQSGELGMLKRGAASEVAVAEGHGVNNLFSGCLAEICPVGALTHKKWRFKTRPWFTEEVDTYCLGCSSCCPCRVSVRDGQVVGVRSRELKAGEVFTDKQYFVCDEGRYGFDKFLPKNRLNRFYLNGEESNAEEVQKQMSNLGKKPLVAFFSPDLMYEEYCAWKRYLDRVARPYIAAVAVSSKVLHAEAAGCGLLKEYIGNDYACNYAAVLKTGLVAAKDVRELRQKYNTTLNKFEQGTFQQGIFIGDRSILSLDIDDGTLDAVKNLEFSAAFFCNRKHLLAPYIKILLPAKSPLEKNGTLINRFGENIKYSAVLKECLPDIRSDEEYINMFRAS